MQSIKLTSARIHQNLRPGKCMRNDSVKAVLKRVERAVALIKADEVTPAGDGKWVACSAAVAGLTYDVTPFGCTCRDREPICKHRWAGPGRKAALLIAAMISTSDSLVLQFIAETVSSALDDVPAPYVNMARRVYKARLAQLETAPAQSSIPA